ncbi:MAG TPA: hypothetical protein VGQ80_06070, partial [Acidimicrobiia bacterium]|nr:hypothetical protein [Acidimicrobiia bacterium]
MGGLVLGRTWWRRASTHLDMEVAAEAAVVSERLRAAEAAVYRHELINAFAAIEGAAMILEQENVGAERDKLHQLLASEIGRLRDLLDPRR